jgi:hypothetical protein
MPLEFVRSRSIIVMAKSAKLAAPHAVVVIGDPSDLELPSSMRNSLVAATASCVAVVCLCENECVTTFTLGPTREVNPGTEPVFRGSLRTPNRVIAIQSALCEVILECSVPEQQTRVRVWTNDMSEPDQVIVGVE